MMLKSKDVEQLIKEKLASGRPKPFSILWLSYDKQRDTAGRVMKMDRAVLVSHYTKERIIKITPYGLNAITSVHYDLILYLNETPTT
ncbi:hypothetical protein [Runella zeae]|uniref:hypothetical protein n=1 Tax=Runella zeae TaxID=94255 RepID=UPI00048F10C8|nr:hypothetical protein [Runella zeae]